MEAVLLVREARIVAYRNFLLTLFTVRQREWPIIKPGIDESLLIARCDEALVLLPYKMRTVLRLRFGLGDGQVKTQLEVGIALYPEVTRQRVSNIERAALKKLRHHTRSKGLKEFIDYVRRD